MNNNNCVNLELDLIDVDVFHDMDTRLKTLCEEDINITLEFMGVPERVDMFLDKEFANMAGTKIADRVAMSKDWDEIIQIEFVSGGDIDHQILKQNEYCLKIFENYDLPITPLMFTLSYKKPGRQDVQWGKKKHLYSTTEICPLCLIDGDKLLNEIRQIIKDNPHEKVKLKRPYIVFLIYAMYTRYSLDPYSMLYELSKIINKVDIKKDLDIQLRLCYVSDCRRFIKNKKQREKIFRLIQMNTHVLDEAIKYIEARYEEAYQSKIKEKDGELQQKDDELQQKDDELKLKDGELKQRDGKIDQLNIKNKELYAENKLMYGKMKQMEETIKKLQSE